MNGRVRLLGADDADQVVRLERELFGRSAWTRTMVLAELGGPGRWYVGVDASDVDGPADATPDGEPRRGLLGYAGLWFDGDVAQVMTIGVAVAAQRHGWGSFLLTALVDRSREVGAQAVLLEVRVDNAAAIAMYERFGFETIGRRRRYYQPEDVDAFTMRLALAGAP